MIFRKNVSLVLLLNLHLGSLFCGFFQAPFIYVKVMQAPFVSLYEDDYQKRWTIYDSCLVLDAWQNRIRLNGKLLAVNKSVTIKIPSGTMSINGVNSFSTVQIKAAGGMLVCKELSAQEISSTPVEHVVQKWQQTFVQEIKRSALCGNGKTAEQMAVREQKNIRVMLDSVIMGSASQRVEWLLEAEEAKILLNGTLVEHKKIVINVINKAVYINGQRMVADFLSITTADEADFIQFNKKRYKGAFMVVVDTSKVFLINSIDLEEYVYAVVRSESWPGWPLEVNKVFAIACRSYAVRHMVDAQQKRKIYHVKDTNVHQRYNLYGEHQDEVVRNAVAQTAGICLTYKGKPALAMFDSCCGGVIPAHIDSFNFRDDPYLARAYPCTFCKKTSLYSWQFKYDLAVFEKKIAKMAIHVLPLKKVKINRVDKAGVVKELLLEGYKHSVKLSAKSLMSVMKDLKSRCFSIICQAKSLTFKGTGLGHLAGLCQWGAWQMVKEGWQYKAILHYYYPGTSLKRLYANHIGRTPATDWHS